MLGQLQPHHQFPDLGPGQRQLALLRLRFVTTIPALADDLGLSRPAASDAVERLVALGLAREVTGRGRDRVFAYGAADAMVGSLLVADGT